MQCLMGRHTCAACGQEQSTLPLNFMTLFVQLCGVGLPTLHQ